MRFDGEDLEYLDRKFGEVHERIDGTKDELSQLKTSLASCQSSSGGRIERSIRDHEKDMHDPNKKAGFWSSVISIVMGVIALVAVFFGIKGGRTRFYSSGTSSARK